VKDGQVLREVKLRRVELLTNPSETGRFLIYPPQRDGRLSWPVTYWNDLPQVLTWQLGSARPGVELATCW